MKTFLLFLRLGCSAELSAQSGELWFSGGASILLNGRIGSPFSDGKPSDVQLGNDFRVGFRFAFNSAGHIGHEIQYAYNRTNFIYDTGAILGYVSSAGTAIYQGGYNLLYYFPTTWEGSKVRPFVTGGVHFSDFVCPHRPDFKVVAKVGFNGGAGVKVKISTLFAL